MFGVDPKQIEFGSGECLSRCESLAIERDLKLEEGIQHNWTEEVSCLFLLRSGLTTESLKAKRRGVHLMGGGMKQKSSSLPF